MTAQGECQHQWDHEAEQCVDCGAVMCERCGEHVAITYAPVYGANFCGPCAAAPEGDDA